MERRELLSRIKSMLQAAFAERLHSVILYGSEARGEAEPDSDIDIMVLLHGPVERWRDSLACIDALYPLVLELERPIHAKPVSVADYQAQIWPLYWEVRKEGILA